MPKDINLLSKPKPTFPEFIFALLIAVILIGMITYTDIILHDYYAKPIIAECYASNDSDFCNEIRELHNLPDDAQIDIGNAYWHVLQLQAMILGIVMFTIRIGMMYLTKGRATDMGIMTATLWGISITALFLTGFVDYGYYAVRGLDVPDELPWLNESGLFVYTQSITGDPNLVDRLDLYITMVIGVILIVLPWLVSVYKYRQIKNFMRSEL